MPTLSDLRTPALLLDKGRLQANLDRMAARANALGVNLRPHMKTAKSIDVARAAIKGQTGGITVSTLAEAEYFARAGFTDILYGVGITPDKLADVAAVQALGAELSLILDNLDNARAVAARAAQLPRSTVASTAPACCRTTTMCWKSRGCCTARKIANYAG